jgi:hypothetical protein
MEGPLYYKIFPVFGISLDFPKISAYNPAKETYMSTEEELKGILDMLHTHDFVTNGGDPCRPNLVEIHVNVQVGKESDEDSDAKL